ncbi:C39 family peptidase [Clostridium minihomine]|uniref:C39 family peptidase n=1 Tax=Clostridium minihomine TaxID=2045012 RepID=UPI001FB356D6|nr:C39 family peptidase [Clostridium minihomine]
MKKSGILIFMAAPAFIVLIFFMVTASMGTSAAGTPVSPVASEEKAKEYALNASQLGAPWDIVILTDAIDAANQKKSGIEDINPIYTTLEFLILTVDAEHYQVVGHTTDDAGETHPVYGWVYKHTDNYIAKENILAYLGIADRSIADLTPDGLINLMQTETKNKSRNNWRYTGTFTTNSDYKDVLTNYIKMNKADTERLLELYESKYLETWLSDETLSEINDIKSSYGLVQNTTDTSNGHKSYEGIKFVDGETEVIYYNQADARWANKLYGASGTIKAEACGPTSMAIVISTLTGTNYDPVYMANWSVQNGYRVIGSGSSRALIPGAARAFGLEVSGCSADEPQRIVDALSSGKLVVAIMIKGHFTDSGHFIVLRGVTADGKILVADPFSYSKSQKAWDLSIIQNEAGKGRGAGGPFWIIG